MSHHQYLVNVHRTSHGSKSYQITASAETSKDQILEAAIAQAKDDDFEDDFADYEADIIEVNHATPKQQSYLNQGEIRMNPEQAQQIIKLTRGNRSIDAWERANLAEHISKLERKLETLEDCSKVLCLLTDGEEIFVDQQPIHTQAESLQQFALRFLAANWDSAMEGWSNDEIKERFGSITSENDILSLSER